MATVSQPASLLSDIEARQDAVLRQLEELEQRIAQVLAEHGVNVAQTPQGRPTLRVAETEAAPDSVAAAPESAE